MPLPFGAKAVYPALALPTPKDGEEDASPFPPALFADDLQIAAALLAGDYPEIVGDDGNLVLGASDLLLYERALGLRTAALIVGSNAGAPGAGAPKLIERRLGDVVYKFEVPKPGDKVQGWLDALAELMNALSIYRSDGLDGLRGLAVLANPNLDQFGRLVDGRGRPY